MKNNVCDETNVKANRNTNRNVEEKANNDRSRNACIFEHRVASRRAVPRFLQQPCVFSSYRHFVATRLPAIKRTSRLRLPNIVSHARSEEKREESKNRDKRDIPRDREGKKERRMERMEEKCGEQMEDNRISGRGETVGKCVTR